jgi:hypothetical protein
MLDQLFAKKKKNNTNKTKFSSCVVKKSKLKVFKRLKSKNATLKMFRQTEYC